jgi:hypothetical protein
MMTTQSSLETLLKKFDAEFDTSYEDQANRVRNRIEVPSERPPKLSRLASSGTCTHKIARSAFSGKAETASKFPSQTVQL